MQTAIYQEAAGLYQMGVQTEQPLISARAGLTELACIFRLAHARVGVTNMIGRDDRQVSP